MANDKVVSINNTTLNLRKARGASQPHCVYPYLHNKETTLRSDAMYVVTKFGTVNLKGECVAERAKAIIALAHPNFREDLEWQAYETRLIPHGVSFCVLRNPPDGL
jgi:acyl-CoA hydrolase